MTLSFKSIAPSMLMAAAFALVGAVNVNGQVVFLDTFDADPSGGATRVLAYTNAAGEVTDNSANEGRFSSFFDVFGIVDRNVNFDFADDSVINNSDDDPDNDDTFGLVKPDKTDLFLGFADTVNDDTVDPFDPPNPASGTGDVSVTWTVPVNGQTGLNLSFDIAAMGDFEEADALVFTASFDGGPTTTIVQSTIQDTPENDGTDPDNPPANGFDLFTYTLDDGSLAIPFFFGTPPEVPESIKDPFAFVMPSGELNIIINEFENVSFPISGTGTELVLTLNYITNGGPEPLAIDNVSVTAGGVVTTPNGDFTGDGIVDCADLDGYVGNIDAPATGTLAALDLDGDGVLSAADANTHITTLVVTSNGTGTVPGDFNCDGEVDVLVDAFILIQNLNTTVDSYSLGDADFSGDVDVLNDAFTLIQNLGFPNN